MAIQNASDLLVYAKTAAPAKQVTRIYIKTVDPISVPDGGTTGNVKILNLVNLSGLVKDVTTEASANNAASLLTVIDSILVASNSYTSGSNVVSGDYTYRDFTNGAVGIVPTLEIVNGTATLNEDAVIIEIVTPGSLAIFDPVAYSTSASYSTNMDLRDVTTKDSNGFSQSLGGSKSFEISTDLLQSINPDVPLDGTDFFDKLKERTLVDLTFSDRIRNIIQTNLTQSGVDGFLLVDDATQTNLEADPFNTVENPSYTASKITVGDDSVDYNRLQYSVAASRLEDKNVTWTFYAKGVGSDTSVSFYSEKQGGSSISPSKVEVLSGTYTTITTPGTNSRAVNGLSTSTFTRIRVTYNNLDATTAATNINFMVFPGANPASQTNGVDVIVSSWQIELTDDATDYQDPTDITHWQGNALVSSLNFDAGVEDNLTCSATFTGTGNVYPNGLGPELIGDTSFDLGMVGTDAGAWWKITTTSLVQSGYGKIITTGASTSIYKDGILTAGDTYSFTYYVHTNSGGNIAVDDVYSGGDLILPNTVSQTHTVVFKAQDADFVIKNAFTTEATTIWLSSASLKKVL
jgi:hypothetical protein